MNVLACVFLSLVVLFASSAHASETNAVTIALESSGCTQSVTDPQLLDALGLELRGEGVVQITRVARSDRALIRIAHSCAGAADEVRVSVRRDENSELTVRSLSLADVPVALRARSVALATAELLRSARLVWASRSRQPSAADEPDTAAPASAVTGTPPIAQRQQPLNAAAGAQTDPRADQNERPQRSDPESPPRVDLHVAPLPQPATFSLWSIALGPALRVVGAQYTVLYGAELSLQWDRLGLAASGLWGGRSDALGSARFRILDGSLAVVALRATWESWALRVGARGALGVVWGDAVANKLAVASDGVATTWNITGQVATAHVLSRRWQLQLALHAGYAGGPRFSADARTLASLSGPLVGACLSAAMGLPL